MSQSVSAARALLIADGDRHAGGQLARTLELRGFAPTLVVDGRSALNAIEASVWGYAVIDLSLPDMPGLRVVQALHQASADAHIVVLSAQASVAAAVHALRLGAADLLCKPCATDDLVAALGSDAPDPDLSLPREPMSVERLEWEHIQRVLLARDGNVSATARELRMHRRTLQRKLAKNPPRR